MKKPVPPTGTVLDSGCFWRGWGNMRLKKSSPKGHSSPKPWDREDTRRSASMRTTAGPIFSAMVTKSRVAFSWGREEPKRLETTAGAGEAAWAKTSGGAGAFSVR